MDGLVGEEASNHVNAFLFVLGRPSQVLEPDVFGDQTGLGVCLKVDRTVNASLVFERGVVGVLTREALVCSWA